jgi:hypothetical protein
MTTGKQASCILARMRHTPAFSRRISPELCISACPLSQEGAGKVGAGWHPRSAARKDTQEEPHSSIQVKPKTQPSLRSGRTAYAALSREPSSFWPPSPQRNSPASRRLTRLSPPQELATTARTTRFCRTRGSPCSPQIFSPVDGARKLLARRACQRRSSARSLGLTQSNPARLLPFAPDAAASTASPARDTDDHMIIPQG